MNTTTSAPGFDPRQKLYISDGMLIDRPITATQVQASGQKVSIAFGFDLEDPIALTLYVGMDGTWRGHHPAKWVFTRAMLAAGRAERIGGDPGLVTIAPKTAQFVEFTLTDRQDDRRYLLSVTREDVDFALAVFDRLVPLDAEEHINVSDAAFAKAIAEILRPPGGPR